MESIESLLTTKKITLELFSNPQAPNKASLYQKLQELELQLLQTPNYPYYCSHCHFTHKAGKIYNDHKSYAHVQIQFPELIPKQVEFHYTMRIVGIHSLKTHEIWRKIHFGTKLQLVLERSTQEIKICYQKKKIGYIRHDKKKKILPIINIPDIQLDIRFEQFQDAQEVVYPHKGLFVCCICPHSSPGGSNARPTRLRGNFLHPYYTHEKTCGFSKDCRRFEERLDSRFWRPPFAIVRITEFRMNEIQRIIKGMLELHEMGHPDISGACRLFSRKALNYVETVLLQNGKIAIWNQIVKTNLFNKFHLNDTDLLL